MIDLLIVWLVLLLLLTFFAIGRPGAGGALVLAYFFGLSLIHVPGALIYADPLAPGPHRVQTELGFALTVIGIGSFTAGAILARWIGRAVVDDIHPEAVAKFSPHIWTLIGAGVFSYFYLMPRAANVPSGTALVSSLGSLLVIGFWLRLYTANQTHRFWRSATTVMLLPVLPASTLATAGFIGYGVSWVLSCAAFLFTVTRRRILFYLLSPVLALLGLSLFASYMIGRGDLRTDLAYQNGRVWSDISAIVANFRILDLNSPLLNYTIDARLNQNYLDGYAAQRYLSGDVDLAYGSTTQLWALIPRAFWPGKPAVGGGTDIVSRFTGLEFSPTTSVGIGQVMEFYINFAMPGVIIGFFIFGFVLMRLDIAIATALKRGDMRKLLLCAMPGLTLLQPGGNMQEVIVAAAGAIVTSRLLTGWGFFGAEQPAPVLTAIPEIAE